MRLMLRRLSFRTAGRHRFSAPLESSVSQKPWRTEAALRTYYGIGLDVSSSAVFPRRASGWRLFGMCGLIARIKAEFGARRHTSKYPINRPRIAPRIGLMIVRINLISDDSLRCRRFFAWCGGRCPFAAMWVDVSVAFNTPQALVWNDTGFAGAEATTDGSHFVGEEIGD